MGKVGSSSVEASLKQAKIGRSVYHAHFLTPDRVKAIERKQRRYFNTNGESSLYHIWRSQYLDKKIRSANKDEVWNVVTLTREPIARNISSFFQNIKVIPQEADGSNRVVSKEHGINITVNNDVSKLVHLFFTRYPHDLPLLYFDFEFRDYLGIDLYQGTFPTAKGFKLYEGQRAKVLLIRMENLDECAAEAFREFLGIENLQLVRRNVGAQKGYAKLYQRFKESITFPESYLDKMYSSKYCQTFYNEAEIEQFRRQWLGTQGSVAKNLELK